MSIKKLENQQHLIIKQLSQQLKRRDFNKVCEAIKLENKIAIAINN